MKREISLEDARPKLEELVDRADRGEEFVILRYEKPAAVLVSTRIYEQHLADRKKSFQVLHDLWAQLPPSEMSEEELDALIAKAVTEVREERRAEKAAKKCDS